MNLLALDLGGTVGAALYDGWAHRTAVLTLAEAREGENVWAVFRDEVVGCFYGDRGPWTVVYEQPYVSARGGRADMALLLGQVAVLQLLCHDREHVEVAMVYPQTWRAAVLGNGKLPAAEAKKQARALAEAATGRRLQTHEADAWCILQWARERYAGGGDGDGLTSKR